MNVSNHILTVTIATAILRYQDTDVEITVLIVSPSPVDTHFVFSVITIDHESMAIFPVPIAARIVDGTTLGQLVKYYVRPLLFRIVVADVTVYVGIVARILNERVLHVSCV